MDWKQSAQMQNCIRQLPTRILTVLSTLPALPVKPGFLFDRNGRGQVYHKLQYRKGRRIQSVYIGAITEEHAGLLQAEIERTWPVNISGLRKQINELRTARRLLLHFTRELAVRCGFSIKGCRLIKRRES